MGLGVDAILERIVKTVPPPAPTVEKPLRALIFDSYYDAYRGVVVFVRVVDGEASTRSDGGREVGRGGPRRM